MAQVPFRYDPSHTALIVIDVQNDFCDPAGAVAKLGSDVSPVAPAVERLKELIDSARASGVRVIFVRTTHDPSDDSAVWLSRYVKEPADAPSGTICRTGSWGAEFYRVEPQPGDVVVTKHRYSAFVDTSLNLKLQTLDVRSLLFTGVATEVCVESSLRDALSHDYHVTLVADGAATYTQPAQDATERVVAASYGTVVTCDELINLWSEIKVTA